MDIGFINDIIKYVKNETIIWTIFRCNRPEIREALRDYLPEDSRKSPFTDETGLTIGR